MTQQMIQNSDRSRESIETVLQDIRNVLRQAYPDKEPDAFITDIDWHGGVTEILIHIRHNLTPAELAAWAAQ